MTRRAARLAVPALAALLLFGVDAMTQAAEKNDVPPDSILPEGKWTLTFEDDFEGPGRSPDGTEGNERGDDLDETVWESTDAEYLPGHIESSRHRRNVVVEEGMMRLVTRREKTTDPETGKVYQWTAGHIWTRQFQQEFGYFEAKIRIAGASGQNNAFWLSPYNPANGALELDITEAHYPSETTANLHDRIRKPKKFDSGFDYDTGKNLAEDFHIYGLEWTPDVVRWYFDGKVVREYKAGPDFATRKQRIPMVIRFSTAQLPGKWDGQPQQNPDGTWKLDGKSMDIDWVRAYKPAAEQ